MRAWRRFTAALGGLARTVAQARLQAFLLALALPAPAALPAKAQTEADQRPVVNINAIILAEPGAETPLAIQVGPAPSIPPQSFLRIRGLPAATSLTEGYAIAPGAWAVPLASLPTLRIRTPSGLASRSQISVMLVDVDGNLLREAQASLVIAAAAVLAAPSPPPPQPAQRPQQAEPPTDSQAVRPSPRTYQLAEALRMLTKGDEMLATGNVALARLYYQRATDMGLARGALALAGTYDETELLRRRILGVQPDAALARRWYERARELGAPEAAERLSRLGEQ